MASCVNNNFGNNTDPIPLRFACISENVSELEDDQVIVSVWSLTKRQAISNLRGDTSQIRVNWVLGRLAAEHFQYSSTWSCNRVPSKPRHITQNYYMYSQRRLGFLCNYFR